MFYYLCSRLCVSSFRDIYVVPVSRTIPDFYKNIPALYAKIPCYFCFYMKYRARYATGGGWRGGVLGLIRVFKWVCSLICQPNSWFLIPDPSLAPVPAGNWGSKLCVSFVNRTSQQWLRFNRLPTPVLEKGVLPFSLPWIDSIAIVWPGIPSISFRPLIEWTAKNVSVSCDSAYLACPFWYFPTWPGALSLVHTCMNPRHHHQFWRQLWCQFDNPINFWLSHTPVFFFLVADLTYIMLGSGTALIY